MASTEPVDCGDNASHELVAEEQRRVNVDQMDGINTVGEMMARRALTAPEGE
ncbi:hypothetical protein HUG10_11740 [Halorarum halophilum]|uniref:Uncharacterized protein n=1 Tax=Halorarum halophilum TaxID=2743090 RepID=A0A7D5KUZ4_9EURY|nr:hypothetical protein [Halobaculum halophilum]QLG28180.1 hypothetical protein HUG10_11740 [Halobaculum halophilum]